jgi:hypothetical protein
MLRECWSDRAPIRGDGLATPSTIPSGGPSMRTRLVAAALLLVTSSVGRDALAAWPGDPATNVPICTASEGQYYPAMVPDGSGGAFIAWLDDRSATSFAVYVQRISAKGVPQWTSNGVLVCSTAYLSRPSLISDDAGGVIVSWTNYVYTPPYLPESKIYAQRLSSSGVARWTAGGVPVAVSYYDQGACTMVADGAGGALLAWQQCVNPSYGTNRIYAQRISSSGVAQWTASDVATNGVMLSAGGSNDVKDYSPQIASDGAGGAIVAWGRNAWSPTYGTYYEIYAQRVSATGVPQWATVTTVAAAPARPSNRNLIADDAGGVIIAWDDVRADSTGDIYAQRISASGAAQWTANGLALCTASGAQSKPLLTPSGTNGAIVAWTDARSGTAKVYGQRLASDGSALWTAGGLPLCAASGTQNPGRIAADGAGGAVLAWTDNRGGHSGLYAQHFTSTGAEQWRATGAPVCTAAYGQSSPAFTTEGAGGTIFAWEDSRGGGYPDIYAQRLDQWGYLNPSPTITGAHDTPYDGGGHVTVTWTASLNDLGAGGPISDYRVWRYPLSTATWVAVDSLTAQGLASYGLSVPTLADSGAAGSAMARFRVEARGPLAGQSWLSDSLASYSVDDPPAAPAPLTGDRTPGVTHLHWPVCTAVDFATFRLYRDPVDAEFVPGPSSLIATQADTGYADATVGVLFYKLCAVDLKGNVSPCATVQYPPADVPGEALPRGLALSAPAPNPLRGSCTMRLALPRAAAATLAVYDQQGRHVRTLLSGAQPAGEHPVTWDGRDDGGRGVASGIYFVRLDCEGRTLTRRIAALR